MSADASAVRTGEELDRKALAYYLCDKIPGGGDLIIEQFLGGHSNLTYLLKTPAGEYVLRRGPLGPVAPKAHDMAREYRVLSVVHPFFPPAPRVFHLCDDTSVIGAVFFIMERRRGIIVRDRIPAKLMVVPNYPERVSRGIIDCLIELHAVDIQRHGLDGLGKPEGFLERQVRGWFDRWKGAKTEELPQMDRIILWLIDKLPVSQPATLVHNDFKLDNVMLNESDPGRIEAVLDWEMASLGDPLVDLGVMLCYWSQPSDPGGGSPALTTQSGWFKRDQLIGRYAEKTGRDVSGIAYYEVFAMFKLAVVLQQIFVRFHRGQTRDERFRHFDQRVHRLIEQAAALT